VQQGRIGELRYVIGSFGYFNTDPKNVRNVRQWGGGALLDIGCYPIKTSRMVFAEEPRRVTATLIRDPQFEIDILTSALLEYPSGHCVFSCSSQIVPNQRMQFFGTKGRIEIEIPFNPLPGASSRIRIDDGRDVLGSGITIEELEPCDQYTIQGDAFSR